ncbi:MFS general substrate transporter [Canariomyces notabilis]|uniref:MFS general substrate transporter n=1 Tax=Canariomyces notabilis TaxID=2074819 RepID=A0AAN6YW33_9PEZI|nr:MFS general substrate transporter [Canariomyces arenarius]
MAPVGAAGGSLVAAVVVQLAGWRWLFFMLGVLGSVVYGITIAFVPADEPLDPRGSIDYGGAYFGVGGLILFNFAWNQAPLAGWSEPYEIVLLVVSVLHLLAFCYWELKVAKEPILPFNIWNSPSFGTLMLTIFFSFMSLGIYFWGQPDPKGLQYLPLTIVGAINSFFAAWLVPRVPAQAIIGAGCLAMVTINVLLATIPADLTYWAMAFPAMFVSAFTIDLITTSAQIIATNTVPRKHQGVAGSLVGTLLSYGMSTGLGFAGTVEVYTSEGGADLLKGYHSAAYLAVGMSGFALVLCFFIRIPRDTREGWAPGDEMAVKREQV